MNVHHELIKPSETNNHIPPHDKDSSFAVCHFTTKLLRASIYFGKRIIDGWSLRLRKCITTCKKKCISLLKWWMPGFATGISVASAGKEVDKGPCKKFTQCIWMKPHLGYGRRVRLDIELPQTKTVWVQWSTVKTLNTQNKARVFSTHGWVKNHGKTPPLGYKLTYVCIFLVPMRLINKAVLMFTWKCKNTNMNLMGEMPQRDSSPDTRAWALLTSSKRVTQNTLEKP